MFRKMIVSIIREDDRDDDPDNYLCDPALDYPERIPPNLFRRCEAYSYMMEEAEEENEFDQEVEEPDPKKKKRDQEIMQRQFEAKVKANRRSRAMPQLVADRKAKGIRKLEILREKFLRRHPKLISKVKMSRNFMVDPNDPLAIPDPMIEGVIEIA